MKIADILNKIMNWRKKEAKSSADESHDEVHKALDALISIKDSPKPVSLQRDRIDAIKSNVIIGKIKDRIKVEDIKNRQKIQKWYIKNYSGYFSGLKAAQFEIKPRVISKITAYKENILKHFKEVYKNEHE